MGVGTIIEASDFPEARNPAYKLLIDFGPAGIKKSSAQITQLYKKEELIGKQIIGVVSFPPRHIAKFVSEVLVLGIYGAGQDVLLLQPERKVENGCKNGSLPVVGCIINLLTAYCFSSSSQYSTALLVCGITIVPPTIFATAKTSKICSRVIPCS